MDELETILNEDVIGVLQCPRCSVVISYLPRYKEALKERKKQVVQVFDFFFALKSNLASSKQSLAKRNERCNFSNLKKHVISRAQDKIVPMSFAEVQDFQMKLFLLDKLAAYDDDDAEADLVTEHLSSEKGEIGPGYLSQLHRLFENILKDAPTYASFSKGSWILSPSNQVKPVI